MPRQEEERERDRNVQRRRTRRKVPEWEDRHGEREGEPGALMQHCGAGRERREPDGPAARIERQGPRRPGHKCGREQRGSELRRPGGNRDRTASAVSAPPLPPRRPQGSGKRRGAGPPARVEVEGAVDRPQQRSRQVRAERLEARRALLDRAGRLEQRAPPERMAPAQRLPEHHADRPHVGGLGGLLPCEPLGRDVGERPRHVSLRGERLRLLDLRQAEVEHTHGNRLPLREQHVGGLDVSVDDAARVRVREGLEHLSGRLDRSGVVELAAAERLAERASRHVLVGDVHVARIPSEPVGALTGRMAQPGSGLRLAFGTRRSLALPRDDLQRDVEAVALVPGQPDGARAAAAKRPQRAVAAQHELALDQGWRCIGHRLSRVGGGTGKSFTTAEAALALPPSGRAGSARASV